MTNTSNPEGLTPKWPMDDFELGLECDIAMYADALQESNDGQDIWSALCRRVRGVNEQAQMYKWMRDHNACIVRPSADDTHSPYHCIYTGDRSIVTIGPGATTYEDAVKAAMNIR